MGFGIRPCVREAAAHEIEILMTSLSTPTRFDHVSNLKTQVSRTPPEAFAGRGFPRARPDSEDCYGAVGRDRNSIVESDRLLLSRENRITQSHKAPHVSSIAR